MLVMLDELSEAHEVRMMHAASDSELRLDALRGCGTYAPQKLQGNLATMFPIVSCIHDPHAASAEETPQLEPRGPRKVAGRHPPGIFGAEPWRVQDARCVAGEPAQPVRNRRPPQTDRQAQKALY
jgi:hypothetical protein